MAYKLADPGTIQLLKSGITLVTALVMLFALGTRIVKLQWIAIITQAGALQGLSKLATDMTADLWPYGDPISPRHRYLVSLFNLCATHLSNFSQRVRRSLQSESLQERNCLLARGQSDSVRLRRRDQFIDPHHYEGLEGR